MRLVILAIIVLVLAEVAGLGRGAPAFAWHGGLNQPMEQCVGSTPLVTFSGTVEPPTGTWDVVVSGPGFAQSYPFQPNADGTFSVAAQVPVGSGYTAKLSAQGDPNAGIGTFMAKGNCSSGPRIATGTIGAACRIAISACPTLHDCRR